MLIFTIDKGRGFVRIEQADDKPIELDESDLRLLLSELINGPAQPVRLAFVREAGE